MYRIKIYSELGEPLSEIGAGQADHLSSLYAHLLENHYIESIVGFDTNILNIFSRDVLKKLKDNDLLWEKMVPVSVADAIKRRGLFGHTDL
jgi:hypothetical protein